MAKKKEERYSSVADLISDLEAIRRGEPPLHARKRYDASLLQGLADSGEVVESAPIQTDEDHAVRGVPLVWIFVMGALLGLSVLFNVILLLVK